MGTIWPMTTAVLITCIFLYAITISRPAHSDRPLAKQKDSFKSILISLSIKENRHCEKMYYVLKTQELTTWSISHWIQTIVSQDHLFFLCFFFLTVLQTSLSWKKWLCCTERHLTAATCSNVLSIRGAGAPLSIQTFHSTADQARRPNFPHLVSNTCWNFQEIST